MGRSKRLSEADALAQREFREAASFERCCAMCGKTGSDWHPHHVIYEQHVVGAGSPPYDARNVMRLCVKCHASHHNRSKVIPLSKLSVAHIAYAFEVLGLAAHYYLLQRYEGTDRRVDQALAQAEENGERSAAAAPAL